MLRGRLKSSFVGIKTHVGVASRNGNPPSPLDAAVGELRKGNIYLVQNREGTKLTDPAPQSERFSLNSGVRCSIDPGGLRFLCKYRL